MERFSFSSEESADVSEVPLSVLTAEIAARKIELVENQSLLKTVVETDGLTPLFNILLNNALPFI